LTTNPKSFFSIEKTSGYWEKTRAQEQGHVEVPSNKYEYQILTGKSGTIKSYHKIISGVQKFHDIKFRVALS